MANINIDADALFDFGVELGIAFSAISDGFKAGMKEYELYGHAAEGTKGGSDAEADEPEPDEKTDISDCRACWCDRCANIEICELKRPDPTRYTGLPNPCVDCRNGMRFKPEEESPCEDFIESSTRNNG